MFISEDGTITGSIDVSRLDEVEPKSDEARAQLDALKAERDAVAEQSARDAERAAELSRRQNPSLRSDEERAKAEDAGRQASQRQQQEADRLKAEEASRQTEAGAGDAEVRRLQGEAEAAGVTVDKRWGADRLRQEIASAQAAKSGKR